MGQVTRSRLIQCILFMPKTIKDEETGEDIEVFTKEEVDQQVTDVTTKHEEEKVETQKAIDTDKAKIVELEDKGKSVVDLRTKVEVAEKTAKEKDETHTKEVEDLKGKIFDGEKQKVEVAKGRLLDAFSENETDEWKETFKKEQDLQIKALGGLEEKTPEEASKILEDATKRAYKIVSDNPSPDLLGQHISSGADEGGAGGGAGAPVAGVSSELRDLGKKFGLEDKDWQRAKDQGEI